MPTAEKVQESSIAERNIPLTLVLSVGLQRVLLDDRNQVLRSAGYTVASAHSLKDAVDSFVDGDFDLVVLCHSLPQRDRNRLACLIRATGSRTPIIHAATTAAHLDPFSDLTVEDVPYKLLSGIRDLLSKSQEAWLVPRKINQTIDSRTRTRFQVADAAATNIESWMI